MKKWILLVSLIAIIVIAGATSRLWLTPLLEFVGAKSDLIQGLADLIQIVLWVGAGVIILFGIFKQKKKDDNKPPKSKKKIQQTTGDRNVSIQGDAKENIIITGDKTKLVISQKEKSNKSALRNAYLSHVFKTSKHLSLAGIDPKAASEAETRLELNAVYTALMTMSTEAHELWQHGKGFDRETQYLSALEQLNRNSHLVLLGDPGSGKSTFVNFVALCLTGEALGEKEINLSLLTAPIPQDERSASKLEDKKEKEKPQQWDHGALIPIRVILRDFAARGLPAAGVKTTAQHLWNFITSELATATLGDYADHLRQELLKKGGLLLLDGLDEVPEADKRRNQIKDAVEDFAAVYPRCRILVTSRTYAYQKQDWRLPDFSETILAPFNKGQIERFIDRWYGYIGALRGLNPDDARGRAELLKRAVFASDRLQSLAERPLLLTLMASLHAWRGGSLPERREQLYADTVDLLLDWWESPKTVRDAEGNIKVLQPSLAEWLKVDRQRVRDLLNELAFRAHQSQPELVGTADIAEQDLVAGIMSLSQNPDVKLARLIEYLSQRAGLLLPRGVGVYTFPHRTFQEYLAACYLTDHDYPDQLAELLRADPNRWREVTLLAGAKAARGAASTIWLLVDALCCKEAKGQTSDLSETWCAHLAGQAIVESADLKRLSESNRIKVARIKNWLVAIIRNEKFPAIERAAAGRTLAKLGDPRPGIGVYLHEQIELPDMLWCHIPVGEFWMGSDKKVDQDAFDYELPQHQLTLPDFYISRYPITNAQFQAFVKAGGYRMPQFWQDGTVKSGWDDKPRSQPHDFGEPFNLSNHPVVGVSWYEALAFCRWLNAMMLHIDTNTIHVETIHESSLRELRELRESRESSQYPLDQFQINVWEQNRIIPQKLSSKNWRITLPSESEWERAARGNDKRIYPWGAKQDPNRANYNDTGIGSTSAVGCFPGGVSPYGCEEMSGNMWEWTRSLWGTDWQKPDFNYPYKSDDGREKLDAKLEVLRVLRGGSFNLNQWVVRCAFRDWSNPVYRIVNWGFRVVLSPLNISLNL